MSEPPSNSEPPEWPWCGHEANPPDDPIGCQGRRVDPHDHCLRHLNADQRADYFSRMRPGDAVDHRGTHFSSELLRELLESLFDSTIGRPRIGRAKFHKAIFSGAPSSRASFLGARFVETASFESAELMEVYFDDVTFCAHVSFKFARMARCFFTNATFELAPSFTRAEFTFRADFTNADFRGRRRVGATDFKWATFNGAAVFTGALFGDADFTGATFRATVLLDVRAQRIIFDSASFETADYLGPVRCQYGLSFKLSHFISPVSLQLDSPRVSLARAKWDAASAIDVERALIDLRHAVLAQPVTIRSRPGVGPSLETLTGVDCAMLSLSHVNLARCSFDGALHLDQLHMEGECVFSAPPENRIWRYGPRRWTGREVVYQERIWRSFNARTSLLRDAWNPGESAFGRNGKKPSVATLASIYRQLRKAREDAKDEPGAADFYYGEMEMRRHSKGWRTAERWLLQAYWLLSGYGLRASRALGWLALAMMTTILLMMAFGLPQDSPKQEATGVVPRGGGKITFEIDKPDPKNPTLDRFTTKRLDKALSVTLNSVVFRSSGQDLTTAGGYIEMVSRFSEPVLLGLAALAIRGRVKR